MSFPQEAGYQEASQSTTILVLGILGLVCCGPLGIVAWIMGNNEIQAIDAGRRDPANRGTANAGRIVGIVATVFLAISVVWLILFFSGAITIPGFDDFDFNQ
jgi:hypothetical protein